MLLCCLSLVHVLVPPAKNIRLFLRFEQKVSKGTAGLNAGGLVWYTSDVLITKALFMPTTTGIIQG